MNEKINVDVRSLKIIFERNKYYIVPVAIILICIILFFQLIIPQFKTLFALGENAKKMALELQVLKNNLNVLMNTNEKVLDSQLKILISALPSDKDFDSMLSVIYSVSQKTGVSLGNFSLKIGNLSESEAANSSPTIKVTVPINSNAESATSFIQELISLAPLSEIESIKMNDLSSFIS